MDALDSYGAIDYVNESEVQVLGLAWAAGFALFLAIFGAASSLPPRANQPRLDPELRLLRRLNKATRICAVIQMLLCLPLVYVATAAHPCETQDSTAMPRGLSWNWWYPRPIAAIVAHAGLAGHVAVHPALRNGYLAFLGGAALCDSVGALNLQTRRRCNLSDRCVPAAGYPASLTWLARRELVKTLRTGAKWLSCLAVDAPSGRCVFATFPSLPRRHERAAPAFATRERRRKFQRRQRAVFVFAERGRTPQVHPGGDHLLAGSRDRRVCWFDLDGGEHAFKTLKYHDQALRAAAYAPRYPLFATAADDGRVQVFHARVSDDVAADPLIVPVKVLDAHAVRNGRGALTCAFHPTQPWLFTGGADGRVVLWQAL